MPKLPTEKCTGCAACAAICPVEAIVMAEDREGFLRPEVAADKCIRCGKCEKTCPIHSPHERTAVQQGVFAAKIRDQQAHKQSQSGGMFFALAEAVLCKGGAVYGAALSRQFETKHIRVTDLQDLTKLQGVKYVQSCIGDTYIQTGRDLQNDVPVLFSGTPCQIAGLYSYLCAKGISAQNLLTADLVCYGVPSPGVFRAWVDCLEKAYKAKLTSMCYRRTDTHWGKGKERYCLSSGKVLEGEYFTKLYFRNLIIRPGCESCRYCNTHRPGDITLGDFWGIDKVMPEFYDDRGVSLVIVNTEKGRATFDRIREQLSYRQSDLAAAAAAQPRLQGIAVKPSVHRAAFWDKYCKKGMAYIAMEEGFLPLSVGFRLRKRLEALIKRLRK